MYALRLEMWLRWLPTTDGRRREWHVDVLSRSILEAWFDALQDRGVKPVTARKYLEVIEGMWAWAADRDEDWHGVPPLRRVTTDIPRPQPPQRQAPSWAEMSAAVRTMEGWHRHVGVMAYYTSLRVQQVMSLLWSDVDLDAQLLTIRPELGKTPSERRGRTLPISAHLVAELRTWPRDTAWIVPTGRVEGPRHREARARDAARAWAASGVRPAVWKGEPWHSFRAGWQTGLLAAGGGWLSTEYYMGHRLPGTGENYVDPIQALGLAELVKLIPAIDGLQPGWAAELGTRRGFQGER